jgi:hypothetical protein
MVAVYPVKLGQWVYYECTGTYVYHGGNIRGQGWKVRRVTVANPAEQVVATEANNALIDNLAAAWTDRATLTYA